MLGALYGGGRIVVVGSGYQVGTLGQFPGLLPGCFVGGEQAWVAGDRWPAVQFDERVQPWRLVQFLLLDWT